MKCKFCSKEAEYKVKDTITGEIIFVCSYCEPQNIIYELIEELESSEKKSVPIVTYGRLHKVYKTRKESICSRCDIPILIGEKCFNQKKQIEGMAFPLNQKVCFSCGNKLISEGTKVADDK